VKHTVQRASHIAGLDWEVLVRGFYRMKATTMTLSERRQSFFPQDWCERVGLGEAARSVCGLQRVR